MKRFPECRCFDVQFSADVTSDDLVHEEGAKALAQGNRGLDREGLFGIGDELFKKRGQILLWIEHHDCFGLSQEDVVAASGKKLLQVLEGGELVFLNFYAPSQRVLHRVELVVSGDVLAEEPTDSADGVADLGADERGERAAAEAGR